jgi:steroid 5-alpha reductase family enzyme
MGFLTATLVSLAVCAVAMAVTALVSRRVGRVSVVDVTWGLAFVLVAVACAVLATVREGGDPWRSWLLAVAVAVWGGRLAWHIGRRARGPGEDPRYEVLLGDGGFAAAVRKVFVVQGLAVWLVSMPLQVAAATDVKWPALVWVGLVIWAVGLFFESVGDAQLAAYQRVPKDQRPLVLDTGLWRYTRHPNYFGDSSVWWGLWVAAGLSSGLLPGLLTIISPLAMTYFVVLTTGARLLEKTMMRRPGYPAYAARTSMFFPLPPKRG